MKLYPCKGGCGNFTTTKDGWCDECVDAKEMK